VKSSDGFNDEMNHEPELELVLAGGAGPPTLTELLTELRSHAETNVDAAVAREHVAAAARAARDRSVVPFVRSRARVPAESRRVIARATMAAAVLLALLISLGSANLLPARVQATMSDIARQFGIDLPHPDEQSAPEPRPVAHRAADDAAVVQPEPDGASQAVYAPSSATHPGPPVTTPSTAPSRGAAGTKAPVPPAGTPSGRASAPSGTPSASPSKGPPIGLPVVLPHLDVRRPYRG